MIHDLTSLARARESQIRLEVQSRQRRSGRKRRRRRTLSALVRRAACRLGTWMVTTGRRLECYDVPLRAQLVRRPRNA